MQPSLGRIVLVPIVPSMNNGADIAPAIVTRVWDNDLVNVRILADSPDSPPQRTSLAYAEDLNDVVGTNACKWTWPPRI